MISANEERIKTNKLLLDICNFNKDLFDTTTLSPEEIRYYNKITDGFNNQIQSYIDWLDSDEAKRIFQDYTQYNDQIFSSIDEYTQEIINDTRLTSDEIIDKIYDAGLTHGYKEIKRTKHYNDATRYGLKFLQEYNFNLISNVNEDLKKHIRTQIFNGIVAGETMPEVAQKILHSHETSLTGKTLSARQRAMMIARTETARAMTQGRLQSYANYGVQEVKILTAGDSSVCAICREAEAKIFPISEAGNLVPFHPLCRCSIMAYIRHGILVGKPLENPKLIDLTPKNNVANYVLYRYRDDEILTNLEGFNDDDWKISNIEKSLTNFVDAKEVKEISNIIYNFIQNARGYSNEIATTYDSKFKEVSKVIKGDTDRFIDIPTEDIKKVEDSYFGLVGHSHTKSKIPLPSCDDIKVGILNLNVKYNLIYAPCFGVILIKKSNPFDKPNKNDLKESYGVANRKRKNYVNNTITQAIDKYKNEIKGNYQITSIQQRKDRDKIRDSVRHSNLKEQCEFYNDELNQYGIELEYITP